MKSPKELALERKLLKFLEDGTDAKRLTTLLSTDEEIQKLQDYANSVSIVRLGFNDHGPVHMRQVAYNAVQMMKLLQKAGVKTNLEAEGTGTFDDSMCAVILASFLHDLGMSVGRQDHEIMSCMLGLPIIERMLFSLYPNNLNRRIVIRSLALEGIAGHMASRKIHSLEAGMILVADGCDMERGRARVPIAINAAPMAGDIHKYSANSIEKVTIGEGVQAPIAITINMSSDVGFFQVEEVLLPKINMSPVKPYIELSAGVTGEARKQYL